MSGEKLLVVDDDRTTCKVMALQLEKFGYTVTGTAHSTSEIFTQVRSTRPDLILMDINLGRGGDGIEAAESVSRNYNIPVVYVTAYSDEITLERAKRTLPYGYINKPIRPTDLRTTIALALERSTADRRQSPVDDIWQIQFMCDAKGTVISLDDETRAALQGAGYSALEVLLPPDHGSNCHDTLIDRRPRILTNRVGERIFSWEYRPANREQVVRVSVTDITEHAQLLQENARQASLSEALDRLATGIIFVNESLKVFYTNKSVERILSGNHDLLIKDGLLACRTAEKTAKLQRVVLKEAVSTFSLERGEGGPPLHLLISPLHSRAENYGRNLPIAIVYIFETVKNSERIEDVIRSLYGLSPTEARIAAKLVLNPDLNGAAREMGITYNTARTHLKRIYAKTNINKLPSLVHMIVTGPVGLLIHSIE